jgi:hypothetical protein
MAGSIGCSLVCVLLFALWARTFFACDAFSGKLTGGGEFIVTSRKNAIGFGFDRQGSAPTSYYFRTVPPNTQPTFRYSEFLGFAYAGPISSGKFAFRVPYWFLVLLTAAVSRVLSKGHIWRFSLRTMLIATTLAAAAMGLAVYLSKL